MEAAKDCMEQAAIRKEEIKKLLVENLMLQVAPDEIRNDQALFGADSLGLDSVDALQLVVALDKQYGLKIPDPASAQLILQSIDSIAAAIEQLPPKPSVIAPGAAG